jgi:hypothetical protein
MERVRSMNMSVRWAGHCGATTSHIQGDIPGSQKLLIAQ